MTTSTPNRFEPADAPAAASRDEGAAVVQGFSRATSLHQFLTDGRLARLCNSLAASAGAEVFVLDEAGRRISLVEPAGWSTSTEPVDLPPDTRRAPMIVGGTEIGSLVVLPAADGRPPSAAAIATVELIAETAAELCGDVQQARQHAHELSALFSLSAILVGKTNVEAMLEAALDSAISALGLNAGSLVLFPDGATPDSIRSEAEEDVTLQASIGLSERWLRDPTPLSRGRLFDQLSMRGEVVAVADLAANPNVVAPERILDEGLGSFIGTGLVLGRRPIGVMRLYGRSPREFSDTERRLVRAIGQQAAAAVQQGRLIELQRAERAHSRQVEMARSIQQRMLPRSMPDLPGLDVAAWFRPSLALSGDFYDLFDREPDPSIHAPSAGDEGPTERHLAMVLGDVVGKGLPAALLMASIRGALLTLMDADVDLARVMSRLNSRVTRETQVREFATIWCGLIEPSTLRLTYACAGHDPPLLFRRADPSGHARSGELESVWLDRGGMVLGIVEPLRYETYSVQLRAGDVLVGYTDGITDARDFDKQVFGPERLDAAVRAALTDNASASAADIVERIRWELRGHVGLAAQVDDQTLVVVRIAGQRA